MRSIRGFSLIELLLVLAIIATLAVASFVVFPRVQAARLAKEGGQTPHGVVHTGAETRCREQTGYTGAGSCLKQIAEQVRPAKERAFTTGNEEQGGF